MNNTTHGNGNNNGTTTINGNGGVATVIRTYVAYNNKIHYHAMKINHRISQCRVQNQQCRHTTNRIVMVGK